MFVSTISCRLPCFFVFIRNYYSKKKSTMPPILPTKNPAWTLASQLFCVKKSHGFKMRVWIITVHSKLAKITIFLMCGAETCRWSHGQRHPPNSIKKCALENLKKEWKKKVSVRLIVCLNDVMNVASYANHGNGLCFHEKKKRNKNPSR